MRIEEFDFVLPEEFIAQYPIEERDLSRLLVYIRKDKKIEHRLFKDIVHFFNKGDVLVLNNTKVIPARIKAQDERGKKVEILLVQRHEGNRWFCLVRGIKKNVSEIRLKTGDIEGELRRNGKFWICEFNRNMEEVIFSLGNMPLPPYIRRDVSEIDFERYQTVYADIPGSIAAPTAGFHFTERLLEDLEKSGVIIVKVTLHIGIGTFFIPKKAHVEEHRMEREFYSMGEDVKDIILSAKKENRRVIACGTSVVRTLETVFFDAPFPLNGYTELFIYPGYKFNVVDCLITNFHLPRSTPLLLVAAFIGREELFRCYEEAKTLGYRFLSYGDAMLIL